MLMPIRAGVLISAFGCLMLSTIYVLPELVGDYQFYPRPWISSLLFGALLLYAESRIVGSIYGDAAGARRIAVYALTVIVVLAALPAPGLILSLFVIVISSVHGNSLYRGAGIAFVAVFTAAYFYGIDVGMLVKSASLAGTGIVVLVCRWLFLRSVVVAPASAGPGSPCDVATGAPESRVAEHKEINPHA
jgi:hypothetical protein